MPSKTQLSLATILLTAFTLPSPSPAATLHVPADYSTIQSCIDAAVSGQDECVVAPGTYNELINFLGKAITIRSSHGPAVTTIDGTGLNGSVVKLSSLETALSVFDGFGVTGGTGTFVDNYFRGGGLYISDASPTIRNCTFESNKAGLGGAIWHRGEATISNCTFSGNMAQYDGGGMLIDSNSSPTVTNCTFSGNSAGVGGGMFINNFSSNPTVTNCTFSRNTAQYNGGGMFIYFDSNPTVSNCRFIGNTSQENGGGMSIWPSNPRVTNCTFSGNTAYSGGGIYLSFSYTTVTNCTFSGNRAVLGGGLFNGNGSEPGFANCILWGDTPHEMYGEGGRYAVTVGFSDLQGGPGGSVDYGGNIDLEPMFVRAPNPGPDGLWDGVDDDYGDLRLQPGSPCINAGDPDFVPQPGETDLDGHARVLCGRVDMGAYEFGIGDYDCDQTVNLNDLSAWPDCMTDPLESSAFQSTIENRQSTIGCESFDFNSDGDVDLADLAQFLLAANPP